MALASWEIGKLAYWVALFGGASFCFNEASAMTDKREWLNLDAGMLHQFCRMIIIAIAEK